MMIIPPAQRTRQVQEYYFSKKNKEMAALNQERKDRGEDPIINLGIGSPDGRPPLSAIETLQETAWDPGNHGYQSYTGIPALREAFARWYRRHYHVILDPASEIQPLVGSKEGILLISLAFLNPGDRVLVPDPGYPTYTSASRIAGAEILTYDLEASRSWQPDFEALERMDLSGVKMMWTNYPNMPTGARATEELYQRIVDFGLRRRILIVNDNPYSFIMNPRPLSIFGAMNARKCCLELNSLSKSHNMAGWRIGMAAGDAEMIAELLKVKSQMDSGMFKPLQLAAVKALGEGSSWFAHLDMEYYLRKEAAGRICETIGARYDRDSVGLFLWAKILPDNPLLREDDAQQKTLGERISDRILYEAGVFITPGCVFGRNGADYIRISLCAPPDVLEQARQRIQQKCFQ